MNIEPYPLMLQPVYKDYIWGGNKINEVFGKEHGLKKCAESWEVADRPEGSSKITNGPLSGKLLGDAVAGMQDKLLGKNMNSPVFPLLVKIIDAARRLSVQVHPNNANAAATGGEPKTEMWYVLAAEPGSFVYAGLKQGVGPEKFMKHLEQGSLEEALQRIPVRAGDAIFIPGGRIHAIAEGCLLLEIQQNSNTTYRVYDWGRLGKDGKPRQLHIAEAMATVDWEDTADPRTENRPAGKRGDSAITEIVACPYFRVEKINPGRKFAVQPDGSTYHILFVSTGQPRLFAGREYALKPGSSCLIPASLPAYTIEGSPDTEIIRITAPDKSF